MPTHSSILLIEDSAGECELFRLALTQTGLDVALYTEHDAEAAFRFLEGQWMAPAMVSTARNISPAQPSARQDAPFPRRGFSTTAQSATQATNQAYPPIILLDWHLRNQHGDDFLRRLRADPRFAAIPVVCFTTSDDSSDLASAYANGANGYVIKPGTYDQLVDCVRDLCSFWVKWNRTSEVPVRC